MISEIVFKIKSDVEIHCKKKITHQIHLAALIKKREKLWYEARDSTVWKTTPG